MSKELKPCPFCGCHDRRVGVRKMGTKGYKIICGKCGSAGPYVKIEDFANKMDAQEKAKEAWNRRANDGKVGGVDARSAFARFMTWIKTHFVAKWKIFGAFVRARESDYGI